MSVRSPNPGSTKAKNGTTGRAMSHPAQPTGVIVENVRLRNA